MPGSDGEDFDPGALADVAEGRDVGAGGGSAPDQTPTPDSSDDAGAAGSSDAGDDGDDAGSAGGLKQGILLLFVADPRGPSDSTFRSRGVGQGLANILDGVTDWLLSLVGKDPGDSLGPAGKIGLGLSQLDVLGDGSSTTSSGDGDVGSDAIDEDGEIDTETLDEDLGEGV
jgi:hypothetical protein